MWRGVGYNIYGGGVMEIQLIIDYRENLKGEGKITLVTSVDPPVDVRTPYLLGILELAKMYLTKGVG